jgi:hypothetical protein
LSPEINKKCIQLIEARSSYSLDRHECATATATSSTMPKKRCSRPAHVWYYYFILLHITPLKQRNVSDSAGTEPGGPAVFFNEKSYNTTYYNVIKVIPMWLCGYCDDGHRVLRFLFLYIIIVILLGRSAVLLNIDIFYYNIYYYVLFRRFDFKNKNCIQSRSYTIFPHCKYRAR